MSLVEKAMPISGDTFNKTFTGHLHVVRRTNGSSYVNETVLEKKITHNSATIEINEDRILFLTQYPLTSYPNYHTIVNTTTEWVENESMPGGGGNFNVYSFKRINRNEPIKITLNRSDGYGVYHYLPLVFE